MNSVDKETSGSFRKGLCAIGKYSLTKVHVSFFLIKYDITRNMYTNKCTMCKCAQVIGFTPLVTNIINIGSNNRATDFPLLRNRGWNNRIRHLKQNPYSIEITVT